MTRMVCEYSPESSQTSEYYAIFMTSYCTTKQQARYSINMVCQFPAILYNKIES